MSYGSHIQNQLDAALAREYGVRKRLEATEDELEACKSESARLKEALHRMDIELTQTMRDWKIVERQRDEAFQLIIKCTKHADNGHAVYLLQNPFKKLLDFGRVLISNGVGE